MHGRHIDFGISITLSNAGAGILLHSAPLINSAKPRSPIWRSKERIYQTHDFLRSAVFHYWVFLLRIPFTIKCIFSFERSCCRKETISSKIKKNVVSTKELVKTN